ncbi:hypothetical protein D5S18_02860 [Nocardia panacis]|uniref:Uncharacterized protein n=1 Tax=Nocardia panacis TaxID=2340916 RepID=A0A3A4KBP2_9NOCA|nr:hypothetical protein D5S18_02860 [Nocardia panacis]
MAVRLSRFTGFPLALRLLRGFAPLSLHRFAALVFTLHGQCNAVQVLDNILPPFFPRQFKVEFHLAGLLFAQAKCSKHVSGFFPFLLANRIQALREVFVDFIEPVGIYCPTGFSIFRDLLRLSLDILAELFAHSGGFFTMPGLFSLPLFSRSLDPFAGFCSATLRRLPESLHLPKTFGTFARLHDFPNMFQPFASTVRAVQFVSPKEFELLRYQGLPEFHCAKRIRPRNLQTLVAAGEVLFHRPNFIGYFGVDILPGHPLPCITCDLAGRESGPFFPQLMECPLINLPRLAFPGLGSRAVGAS